MLQKVSSQIVTKRLSTILEEEIPEEFRSEIVVVSGPSHAEETIVRDITLITAASKDLETAQYVQTLLVTTTSVFIPIQMYWSGNGWCS